MTVCNNKLDLNRLPSFLSGSCKVMFFTQGSVLVSTDGC